MAHRFLGRMVLCAALCGPLVAHALELNQATEAELDSLRGIGPALSRRVMAARQVQAFTDWSDFLQRVSGLGPAKAQSFSDQGLTVQGKAYTRQAP